MTRHFDEPIFVLGMPRSGTSMVAAMLALCGAWVGRTVGPSPYNPKGFWENERLRETVNKPMLRALECDPLGVTPVPDPARMKSEGPTVDRDQVRAILEDEGYGYGGEPDRPWLFKDAKLTLLWPAWLRAFPDARWVIVQRRVNEIIASCIRTPFMNQHSSQVEFWGQLHDTYTERLKDLSETVERWATIHPAKMVHDGDFAELEQICAWAGLEFKRDACAALIDRGAWHEDKDKGSFVSRIIGNVPTVKTLANVKAALAWRTQWKQHFLRPVQQLAPYEGLCIVGGGPSLADDFATIRAMQKRGYAVMALNNTHRILPAHGIIPDLAACADARPENANFYTRTWPGCRYLIASRCDPAVFARLRAADVWLWHYPEPGIEAVIRDSAPDVFMIPGGTSVGIMALSLGGWGGFWRLALFGYDSCYSEDGRHHAYDQPLNDDEKTVPLYLGDRTFRGTIWMGQQALDFRAWLQANGHLFEVSVHGTGLIPALAEAMVKEVKLRSALDRAGDAVPQLVNGDGQHG